MEPSIGGGGLYQISTETTKALNIELGTVIRSVLDNVLEGDAEG
jgi:hypothetical protein